MISTLEQEARRRAQFEAAADAGTEILGRTGDSRTYHQILIACDGFDPKAKLSPEEDTHYRRAFEDLYTTFGSLAPIIKQLWQGAASVREARAKQSAHT